MYLQIALTRSGGTVQWILDMHEEARSIATTEQWNAAKQRADQWFTANPGMMANAAPAQAPATATSGVVASNAPANGEAIANTAPLAPVAPAALTTQGTISPPVEDLTPAVAVPTN